MTRTEEILGRPMEKSERDETIKHMIGGVLEGYESLGEKIKTLERLLEEQP